MRLVVVDLETTGLDEMEHALLEVGAVLLDEQLCPQAEFSRTVFPVEWAEWEPQAQKMHDANGLSAEAALSPLSPSDVDLLAWDWLDRQRRECGNPDESFVLAGSGVSHFDRRWMKRDLPRFESLFTYWSIDIGHLRRFATRVVGMDDPVPVTEKKPHRALDDALLHVQELQGWAEVLGGLR